VKGDDGWFVKFLSNSRFIVLPLIIIINFANVLLDRHNILQVNSCKISFPDKFDRTELITDRKVFNILKLFSSHLFEFFKSW